MRRVLPDALRRIAPDARHDLVERCSLPSAYERLERFRLAALERIGWPERFVELGLECRFNGCVSIRSFVRRMWLWLVKPGCSIARRMLSVRFSLATFLSGLGALAVLFLRARNFLINSTVAPAIIEQTGEGVPTLRPFVGRHAADSSQLLVVIWQAVSLPVMHDEEHVRAMLRRAQMAGVGEVVGDVEGHPRAAHSSRPQPRRAANATLSNLPRLRNTCARAIPVIPHLSSIHSSGSLAPLEELHCLQQGTKLLTT